MQLYFFNHFFVVPEPGSETTEPYVKPETCKENFLYAKCCPDYDDDIIPSEGYDWEECEACSCGDVDPKPGLAFLLQNLTTIL